MVLDMMMPGLRFIRPVGKQYRPFGKHLVAAVLGLVLGTVFSSKSAFSQAAAAQDIPVFVDRTAENAINHVYSGDWDFYVGGGVAAFDCDDDGYPDLYAAAGEGEARLYRNRTAGPGQPLRFAADDAAVPVLSGVTGAYAVDLDGDAVLDLAVLTVAEDRLLRGLGSCRFEDVTERYGLETGQRWTTAFSATFEDGLPGPTLAFGHYVDRANPDGPFEACDDQQLFRPEEKARYGAPIALSPGFCTLSMLFTDWARTGRQDLMISNDRHYYVRAGQEQLWAMESVPRLYGPEDGWARLSIWGMGIASRDINRDGLNDLYLTSMGDQKLRYHGGEAGRPVWSDAPFSAGATAHKPYVGDDGRPSTGWHAEFADFNNDGRDDLFIAKGNVDQMPDMAAKDPNNLLLGRGDGTFHEVGHEAGVDNPARSRGAAIADLNGDGLLDLVVVSRRAPMQILENTGPSAGDWIGIALRDDGPNRFGVGAFIEVEADGIVQTREVTIGGGHAGGAFGVHHFGLGAHDGPVRVRVVWPDGQESGWEAVETNQRVALTRSAAGFDVTVLK